MIIPSLHWKYFDWTEFQTLCISIAEMIVPDCNFSHHLKLGQNQDGIDLLAFERKEGKLFCIQCKREKKMTEGDIKRILNKFKDGGYFNMSSHFVIATSADLQKRSLQSFINSRKIELYNEFGIRFDCWDVTTIETYLEKRWDLVAKYFGKQQADQICNPQLRFESFHNIEVLPHYIRRKLNHLTPKGDGNDFNWSFAPIETFSLTDLIKRNLPVPTKICITADAYQGKTTYIKQSIVELKQSDNNLFQPIFIQIKDFNVQPIEQLLTILYGEWKNIPLKDLLLIIDGVDEVPEDKFVEMIKHINEFHTAYLPVSIVFSCRKFFYFRYNVSLSLPDFKTFELYPLQPVDVDNYLKSTLRDLINEFKALTSITGISGFLYNPFYLVNIVEEFLKPPHKLPNSKIKVIESLIERSFDLTKYRKIRGSASVGDESVRFKTAIEKFAFALQLAGVNSFNSEDIQHIFNYDERLLLQNNSLVSHSENSWGFNNALFQEHIAANKLSKLNFEDLVKFCTVGVSIKKIKTKWIQTIASLISILDPKAELFNNIFKLIENDNIELLFKTESSKYTEELKVSILEKLIEKCETQNIRTLLVDEDNIGMFINTSAACKNYLLKKLSQPLLNNRVKIVCCRILRNSSLDTSQQKQYSKFVIEELSSIIDPFYGGSLIQVLSSHKIGDYRLIEELMSFKKLNEFHEYRDNLYELITELNLVDTFYSYAINGIDYLIKHNTHTHYGGSEYNLEKFLLSSKNPEHLTQFLGFFIKDGWSKYYERNRVTGENFLKNLFDKLADNYPLYPYMIFSIARLIHDLGRNYMREDFVEIDKFLDRTDTHWLAVRILISEIFNDKNWEIGSLITYNTYDYILFEFEESGYQFDHLLGCFSGLRRKNKIEIGETFYNSCIDAFTDPKSRIQGPSEYDLYQEAEKKKHENDLIHIKSLESFTKGLKKYFTKYKKTSMSIDDLFIEVQKNRTEIRKSSDSNFLFNYLSKWHSDYERISLNQCIKELNTKDYFEIFRVEEILTYNRRDEETDKVLLPIIENYYRTNLPNANFKNCLWIENGMLSYLTKEFRLCEIFKKFKFETPEEFLFEFVWLDSDGTRGFETSLLNRRQSISQIILSGLTTEGKTRFAKKILENIKVGIKLESVLGTHIGLCRHLKIIEARDYILSCIYSMSNQYTFKPDSVDIYLELGGDTRVILSLLISLRDYNDYFFYFLVLKLYQEFPKEVSIKVKEAFYDSETKFETKISFARILTELGDIDSFAFLVNEVRKNSKSPYSIQGSHPISKVDTTKALNEIRSIDYFLVDERFNDRRSFHDSARSIILEWLNTLGAKSENDLHLVIEFLEDAREKLMTQYHNASDINWYINRMLEDFRNSDNTSKPISEIKYLLQKAEFDI